MTLEEDLEDILGPAPVQAAPRLAPPLAWPLGLTDEELELEEQTAAAAANARQVRFAQEHAAGASVVESARRAGLSVKNASPYKTAQRLAVKRLVAVLRERARRAASLTVIGQIQRFQDLGRKAEASGDISVALAAEVQVNKLGGLAGLLPKDEAAPTGGATVQFVVITGVPQRDHSLLHAGRAPALPGSGPRPAKAGVSTHGEPVFIDASDSEILGGSTRG